MKIDQVCRVKDTCLPENLLRIDYRSDLDQLRDWALIELPATGDTFVVFVHGHGSHGDQLYTRADIRDEWLPCFRNRGFGILSTNLRDDAWMSPAAVDDMKDLLSFIRQEYGVQRFIFASGSMGGTSNLIYACIHPEDVSGVVALGAATDLDSYYAWCKEREGDIILSIADAIQVSYGGTPVENPAAYEAHSVQKNASLLTMPVFVSHGDQDSIIPVCQVRALAEKMGNSPSFKYSEIPGEHDAPHILMETGIGWAVDRI